MGIASDLTQINTTLTGVSNNKVTRLAYTQQAYTGNDVDSPVAYDYAQDNNIPPSLLSSIKLTETQVDKGFRVTFPSIPKLFFNHFFGRVSYNLNKLTDSFNSFLTLIINCIANADGLASLDSNGRIPVAQIPEDVMEYQGSWDASTNTPTLVDGTGNEGDMLICTVGGTVNFGHEDISFLAGDRVVYNGSVWERLIGGAITTVCEIAPSNNGNLALTAQTDITKIFSINILNTLLWWRRIGAVWVTGAHMSDYGTSFSTILHANNMWVAGGDDYSTGLWYSVNGIDWYRGSGGDYGVVTDIYYADGKWLAVFDLNTGVVVSSDGINWTIISQNITASGRSMYFANNVWVLATTGGLLWSANTTSWTKITNTNNISFNCVRYANGIWVAVGQGMWWSTDGKNWTQGFSSGTFNSVYFYNNLWVASGYGHTCWSNDGKTWNDSPTVILQNYTTTCIYHGNDLWVLGTNGQGLWWSNDGKNWTQCETEILNTASIYHILYADGIWVATTSKGAWWSYNGVLWHSIYLLFMNQSAENLPIDTTNLLFNGIEYADGKWLAGGKSGSGLGRLLSYYS